jgi:DNA invertase Pin-like site-specific DNA recombinase
LRHDPGVHAARRGDPNGDQQHDLRRSHEGPHQRAGIEHAKASGERYKGRKPSFTRRQFEIVRDMLGQETGVSIIAQTTGLSQQTIYRIKDDAAGSEAALVNWAGEKER